MKKLLILLSALVLMLSFASCQKPEVEIDMTALGTEIAGAKLFTDEFVAISADRIQTVVGIDVSKCESAEYHMGSGVTGEEYGLFVCNSAKDAEEVKAQLEARQADQAALYAGYAPEAVPLIEGAVLRQQGKYVVYIVSNDNTAAAAIVDKYFS